jgi:protein-tyrosine phosphatase
MLDELTSEDFELLASLDIRLVCDLRSAEERNLQPYRWPITFAPQVIRMDVNADLRARHGSLLIALESDTTEAGAIQAMLQTYRDIPDGLLNHIGNLIARLVEHDDSIPILIHCTAGKDRTGVLAALIQLALGVPIDHVYDDYLLTKRVGNIGKLKETIEKLLFRITGKPVSHDVVSVIADVRESYLNASLLAIKEKYTSLSAYFEAGGVSQATLGRLRHRLLEA